MKCSMCGPGAGCNGCPIGADFFLGESLADLRVGDRAVVQRLDAPRGADLRKLLALGLLPGVEVEIERCWPAVVLRMGRAQLALDAELAEAVLVARAA
jgi:ferrous iron transport protein A